MSDSERGIVFSGLGPFRLPGEKRRVAEAAAEAERWLAAAQARRAMREELAEGIEPRGTPLAEPSWRSSSHMPFTGLEAAPLAIRELPKEQSYSVGPVSKHQHFLVEHWIEVADSTWPPSFVAEPGFLVVPKSGRRSKVAGAKTGRRRSKIGKEVISGEHTIKMSRKVKGFDAPTSPTISPEPDWASSLPSNNFVTHLDDEVFIKLKQGGR